MLFLFYVTQMAQIAQIALWHRMDTDMVNGKNLELTTRILD